MSENTRSVPCWSLYSLILGIEGGRRRGGEGRGGRGSNPINMESELIDPHSLVPQNKPLLLESKLEHLYPPNKITH